MMRRADEDITQQMSAFCERHGNDALVEALGSGRLVLILVDAPEAPQLRVVTARAFDILERTRAHPSSVGEFWGTWSEGQWSPSLEAATRIGVRNQSDRVIVNDQAAKLFLYGRDVLGPSILHRDDGLRRGDVAWVADRHLDVLGLAHIVDAWSSKGAVLRPVIDLGWYLREGG